jgi:putative membrane protein
MSVRTRAAHVVRGALIGCAEAIPGVSGGTVALVTGVYEAVITSAGHVVSGVKALVTDRPRARAEFAAVRWDVVLPLLLGMAPALVIALRFLGPAIGDHPVHMRALFFGMVAASLLVPIGMLGGRWRLREVAAAVLAAAAAFLVTGAPQLVGEPRAVVVFLAAAVAVCALVLPGVSGAFLLLTFGLYEPTSEAVRNWDLGYLAIFALGMVVGLSLFVKGLQWLLEHHRRVTVAAMTGLIIGALRALWPWQGDQRELLAPDSYVGPAIALAASGAVVVIAIIWIERRARRDAHPPRYDEGGSGDAAPGRHARRAL